MKSVFIVGAKLLGVLAVLRLVGVVAAVSKVIEWWALSTGQEPLGDHFGWFAIRAGTQFVLYAILAFLLFFRTEWLARLLRIPETARPPQFSASDVLLRVGIALIGVYLVATNLPLLVGQVYNVIHTGLAHVESSGEVLLATGYFLSETITPILSLAIAAIFLFRAEWVMALIRKGSPRVAEAND